MTFISNHNLMPQINSMGKKKCEVIIGLILVTKEKRIRRSVQFVYPTPLSVWPSRFLTRAQTDSLPDVALCALIQYYLGLVRFSLISTGWNLEHNSRSVIGEVITAIGGVCFIGHAWGT